LIATRDEAKARGLTRYFNGNPCKHGHISERLVSNCRCVDCSNHSSSEWKRTHLSVCSEQKRKWTAKNRDKVRALKKSYYKDNPKERELQAKRSRKWLEENRDKSRAASAKWRESNLAVAAAAASRRKAKKLQRTPSWADHDKIRQFYILAKELTEQTGVEHEVDHIYPLQGELVSGLHVETNLQILTKTANRAKGNRFCGWIN
jgi:hypothetical protein